MQQTPPIVFDRAARRKHLARRAARLPAHDFLWREGAALIGEAMALMRADFPCIAELMPRTHHLTAVLQARPGTCRVITPSQVQHDAEWLPFAENSLDAIASNMSLHAVNDLPGVLVQARRALRPDGLFIATLPGAESLRELRQVFAETEIALRGGITPRIAPFPELREMGHVLQRAGFALPVVDSVTLTITYPDLFALMHELRGAGEANTLQHRLRHFTGRGFFAQAAAWYAAQHGDAQGIRVSAEILTLTAWKPAPSQQRPARRGSGARGLGEALNGAP